MKKHLLKLFSFGMITSLPVYGDILVEFTEAGYVGTGTTQLWSDCLQAQNGGKTTWVENTWGSYAVDSTFGHVVVDGTRAFRKAIYQTSLTADQTDYSVGIAFTFNRSTGSLSDRADILAVEFTEQAEGGGRLSLTLERMNGGNSGNYRLSFFESTGSSNSFGNAGWMSETVMGFADESDTVSDKLYLEMTLSRGADDSSGNVSGTLTNLTMDPQIPIAEFGTDVVGNFDTSDAFFTGPLYGLIGSGVLESESHVSNRLIDSFSLSTLPGMGGDPVWAGLPVDENGNVDTGDVLGWINVSSGNWVWSYNLEAWLYLEEPTDLSAGVWSYVTK